MGGNISLWFWLRLPGDEWCWASFLMSLGHLPVFFGKMSVQILCLFFNWVIWFYFLSVLGLHCAWAFSSCSEWGLFSGSDMWASLPYDIWNLPKPGTEPMFPALTGRLLASGPSGKRYLVLFVCLFVLCRVVWVLFIFWILTRYWI